LGLEIVNLRVSLALGLIFFPALAVALAPIQIGTEVPEGESLRRELKGVWCASDDGGKTCWGFDHYVDDRVIEACGRIPETGQSFYTKGEYLIRGRKVCIVVTESNDPKAFPPSTKFCVEVLRIDGAQQRHRFIDTGTEDTTYRRPVGAMQCPTFNAPDLARKAAKGR